jgi:hypothetical protein
MHWLLRVWIVAVCAGLMGCAGLPPGRLPTEQELCRGYWAAGVCHSSGGV